MKILFLNNQFERGGAARVASILCNELYYRGYDIQLVTDWANFRHTYHIDDGVKIKQIDVAGNGQNLKNKIQKWFNCTKSIRRYIKEFKPNIIIATESIMFLCAWIANIGLRTPIIAADHTSFTRKIDPVIDFVRYRLYSRATGLSILTKRDANTLGSKYPHKRVIYNPLSFPILKSDVKRGKNILCAGRLESWNVKGFDIILRIWSEIHQKYPEWTLDIAGDANNKDALTFIKNLISDLKLNSRVNLLGQVNDMKSFYSHSSIFALPSRIEGFPMVLMEAMSQGCACVAFSISGASDEMMGSEAGIIVKDCDLNGFKKGLEMLLNNDDMRESVSRRAIKNVSRFSVQSFVDSWEKFIEDTLNNK